MNTNKIYNLIEDEYALIIRRVLNLPKGERYSKKMTLEELINHKVKIKDRDQNFKFKYYVSLLQSIEDSIKEIFPFVNLKGINLNWTSEQILDVILKMFITCKEMTLEDINKEN